nr:sensory transduction histidine kinase [Tanacetum cinerariifolium]
MRGSIDSLLALGEAIPLDDRRELLEGTRDEAERLDRYIQNLLDMTRLGHGALKLARDWVSRQRAQPVTRGAGTVAGHHSRARRVAAAVRACCADRAGTDQRDRECGALFARQRPIADRRQRGGGNTGIRRERRRTGNSRKRAREDFRHVLHRRARGPGRAGHRAGS